MAKRLTEDQKNELISIFKKGIKIEELSQKFNCTKLTIVRNLKKALGESRYKEIINKTSNSINETTKIEKSKKNKSDIESSSANNPQLPKIILVDLNATVTNALKGETIVGETSGASAVFVESNGTNEAFHKKMT